MASNSAAVRLRREFKRLNDDPAPSIIASPIEKNILEWRFILRGSDDTDYAGGHYHGKIKFPNGYPFAPPSIQMITPSGRFVTNSRICFSMSDFHPESWSPLWSVGTILTGLLSFMNSEEQTTGSMEATSEQRKEFARLSKQFNSDDKLFREVFGDVETVSKKFQDIDALILSKSRVASATSSPAPATLTVTPSMNSLKITSAASPPADKSETKENETVSEVMIASKDPILSKSAKKRARKKKGARRPSLEGSDACADLDDGDELDEVDV